MAKEERLNRIRVVLAEKELSNKWLAEKLGKSEYTISRWTTNKFQPSLPLLFEIAKVLNVDVRDLIEANPL